MQPPTGGTPSASILGPMHLPVLQSLACAEVRQLLGHMLGMAGTWPSGEAIDG